MALSRVEFNRSRFSSMSRVGLLTGTFDPVHLGHIAMARAAIGACELDEVWFLVNPAPAHKTGVTALVDRMAMVRLAVAGGAAMREGAPDGAADPAAHTMAEFGRLMAHYPDTEFVFIVGIDVLATLDTWNYSEIVRSLSFAVARRAGGPEIKSDGHLRVQWLDLAEHTEASSRQVKAQLRAGERPAELDDGVFEYIQERGLYRVAA